MAHWQLMTFEQFDETYPLKNYSSRVYKDTNDAPEYVNLTPDDSNPPGSENDEQ